MSSRSAELFSEAKKYLAGGVSRNTLLRTPHPFYADRGVGCWVHDVDGVERIDFANNMASLIHGHAHPAVVDAVSQQLRRGTAFTMATEVEIEHARHLCGRAAGFDRLRFFNSGTEAVMAGIKASRAYTGRHRIAKVEGTYHGAYDYVEVSQAPTPATWGSDRRPNAVPLASGTPQGVLDDVVVLPFNDVEASIARLDEHRADIACVLIDPMPHRVGFIPASEAYFSALHEWTKAHGALLLCDEVITFRTEYGGMQERYGIRADLTTLGKIIGGGFPVGALAGREDAMDVFIASSGDPRLPQSGTFSGNPITMTGGLVAMQLYDGEAVARLNALGERARKQIQEAISASGAPACVTGAGSIFRIHMKANVPTDFRSAYPSPLQKTALRRFTDAMYESGIIIMSTGAGVLSTAMAQREIDILSDAVLGSLRQI